jgi:tRNA(Ile2) C34 agmatinyltransferase TiaS
VTRGTAHLARHWMEGSDPGLCVAWEGSPHMAALTAFGDRAAVQVVTQAAAHAAAAGFHLSGHGGTEDGVIGAAAGAGLTAGGWHGRLIEYRSPLGHLRDVPDPVSVAVLREAGITVVTLDRDAPAPLPDALVHTEDWLRPRLWAGTPVLPVQRDERGGWLAVGPRTIATSS